MSVSNEIQAFLVQALLADAGVAALVGDRVWDDVPDRPPYPYCSIGPSYSNRRDVTGIRRREHFAQVDCWTDQQGRRDQVNDLMDAIELAIDTAGGDLATAGMVSRRIVLSKIEDLPDGKRHGIVQVRFLVEE